MSAPTAPRRGETGQALALALLVRLLCSVACALVGADLMLKQRRMQEAAAAVQVRGLLDTGFAHALGARRRALVAGPTQASRNLSMTLAIAAGRG